MFSLSDVTAKGHDRDQIVEPGLIIAASKRSVGTEHRQHRQAPRAGKVVDVDRILGLLSPVAWRTASRVVKHFECVATPLDELFAFGIVTGEASGVGGQIWLREARKSLAVLGGGVRHGDFFHKTVLGSVVAS